MFKELILTAICCASLPLFAQQASPPKSLADFNKLTGSESIIVSPVSIAYPFNLHLSTLTAEQANCVELTIQGVKDAAVKVYGTIEAFNRSLVSHRYIYRIELTDMTKKETRAAYGEGKRYARIILGDEEVGNSIFLRPIIANHIATYIDPDTNEIACAASSVLQVERFLTNQYQAYIHKYYPEKLN